MCILLLTYKLAVPEDNVMIYDFSERLKTLRKRDNISQNALSKTLGVTRATVNAWEMGISYPNAQSLIMLSKYFNVSVDYLLGIDDGTFLDISGLDPTGQELISKMVKHMLSLQ